MVDDPEGKLYDSESGSPFGESSSNDLPSVDNHIIAHKPIMQPNRAKAFEDEILHTAIVECYMQLSRATRQENDLNDAELNKEENRLRKLSNIVLIDYVKGMCELLYS